MRRSDQPEEIRNLWLHIDDVSKRVNQHAEQCEAITRRPIPNFNEQFNPRAGWRIYLGHSSPTQAARPQRIEVPESLRRILRDWWTRAGKPITGHVFPPLRGKSAGVDDNTAPPTPRQV